MGGEEKDRQSSWPVFHGPINGPIFLSCTGEAIGCHSSFSNGGGNSGETDQPKRPASSAKEANSAQQASQEVAEGLSSGVVDGREGEHGAHAHDELPAKRTKVSGQRDLKQHSVFAERSPNSPDIRGRASFGSPAGALAVAENRSPNRSDGTRLHVNYLPNTMTNEGLHQLFQPFGHLRSAKVIKDRAGASRGFGFVTFARTEEADAAIKAMHSYSVEGQRLAVYIAESGGKERDRRGVRSPSPRLPASPLSARARGRSAHTSPRVRSPIRLAGETSPVRQPHSEAIPPVGASALPWRNVPQAPGADTLDHLPGPFYGTPPLAGLYNAPRYSTHARAGAHPPTYSAPAGGQHPPYYGALPAARQFDAPPAAGLFDTSGGQHRANAYPDPFHQFGPNPQASAAAGHPYVTKTVKPGTGSTATAAAVLAGFDVHTRDVCESSTSVANVPKFPTESKISGDAATVDRAATRLARTNLEAHVGESADVPDHVDSQRNFRSQVLSLSRIERVGRIIEVLQGNDETSYPVLQSRQDGGVDLLGTVLRSHLLALLQSYQRSHSTPATAATENKDKADAMDLSNPTDNEAAGSQTFGIESVRLSPDQLSLYVDLLPISTAAPSFLPNDNMPKEEGPKESEAKGSSIPGGSPSKRGSGSRRSLDPLRQERFDPLRQESFDPLRQERFDRLWQERESDREDALSKLKRRMAAIMASAAESNQTYDNAASRLNAARLALGSQRGGLTAGNEHMVGRAGASPGAESASSSLLGKRGRVSEQEESAGKRVHHEGRNSVAADKGLHGESSFASSGRFAAANHETRQFEAEPGVSRREDEEDVGEDAVMEEEEEKRIIFFGREKDDEENFDEEAEDGGTWVEEGEYEEEREYQAEGEFQEEGEDQDEGAAETEVAMIPEAPRRPPWR